MPETVNGFQKRHVGSDYRDTTGLLISQSGGVANKPVNYQELDEATAALESAYQAADTATQAAINAEATRALNAEANLQLQIQDGATREQIQTAVAQFYQVTHFIYPLAGGTQESGATIFYVPLPLASLNWSITRISEAVAPFQEVSRPAIEWVESRTVFDQDGNPSVQGGYFAKLTFYSATPIADSSLNVYVQRFYNQYAGEYPVVVVPLPSSGSGS